MSDPIERQAAKEAYCKKFCHPGVMCPDSGFCREVDEAFDPVPSAQPEIIHCRDCRYSIDFYQDGCCYCKRPSKEMRYIEEGYGFYCAGAERRTDGRD